MPNKMQVCDVCVFYGNVQAINHVSLDIPKGEVTAFIGPSGCGKSTLLRCLNRMNDTISGCRIEGTILLDGKNINERTADVVNLRRRVGMVFQRPTPFPMSIFDNVAFGVRAHNQRVPRDELHEIVQTALEQAGLWQEVQDKLRESGTNLSGGQQQRLCIARAIAINPEVILMDEPCSALDPTATAVIEELIDELREDFTIVIVTHNMGQAARVSQRTAFFYLGELVEYGTTEKMFNTPDNQKTQDYITGSFG